MNADNTPSATDSADDRQANLARRAVVAPGWRWLDGMVNHLGEWAWNGTDGLWFVNPAEGAYRSWPGAFPDLSDPATKGCLLALVRVAWGEPGIGIRQRSSGAWQVLRPGPERSICQGDTEAEALVSALEGAPRG